ncbi:50S ribosomal protein L3 [Candidatus Nomurabacteria bacterium RIFCSPHIGHO2_01_FULL_39_220]|uniref:50S ribosomal protein L3 n=1 Tax=Candidatus Nomurabacteria bacterium RIFCSPLOWO2_02_FULL_40_67 TaxID=1801787 RepID=A0A1F6Y641_9BACT|nr:MAG: 50S ribosomal protein L3 [Candidatus Nomurabacteria bacterium RBG_16_40_11]OGI70178.1 MAG: 50S ribosomal protein L3 [Candidatus Nomurabacteria bacterium RIFCSPHIGHO2_01_FULL_39_220]OGI72677.1 MAG: 50S ribosomal protein L3 [Candidatus Nomurabacteria bacterium RIFCSPHIGHO2_02_41_18]OGI78622.1 MAG: 50S ribosomal protein L3 [Candidatus Nomurabacteria bacterium RIFCSPHIGHO2_02_FULL_41_150]OGI81679.1 MAG: 50S ribosomal protein L3 [Candidatus Nomurabacteria bacterium RIFCSPHIGHO2_12_FULL_40_64
MKFILATKENMTEYFSPKGTVIPVTILTAGPVTVTRIFSKDKDGYDSVQVGFRAQKKGKVSKGSAGAMKGAFYKTLKEFRLKPSDKSEVKEGDTIDVSIFAPGDLLQISSISKGKGFQGVVKRHGFSGGPRTHGQKHSEREAGSIGGGLRTHVPKGMRMAGRMGSDRITQKNLKVVSIDKENNIILVKGAIAGKRGTLVEIVSR